MGCQHRLSGHESEQTQEDSNGQRSLACCNSQAHKELDTTERLNNKHCHQLLKVASVLHVALMLRRSLMSREHGGTPKHSLLPRHLDAHSNARPGSEAAFWVVVFFLGGVVTLHRTQIPYPLLCQWLCSLGGSKLGWEPLYTYLVGIFSEGGVR